MTNLVVLNLSFNKITTIEFLPKTLKELYLTGNQITNVNCESSLNLIHLGLGYNGIDYYKMIVLC